MSVYDAFFASLMAGIWWWKAIPGPSRWLRSCGRRQAIAKKIRFDL